MRRFHIGHMMEYIQADIWVRFQRMRGAEVHFVGADDAHGAPIMIAAEKAGQDAAGIRRRDRRRPREATSTASTSRSTTGARPTRRRTTRCRRTIYLRAAQERADRRRKTIEQFFDPVKSMFLPDRYIKGECPSAAPKDQYGDSCENCGAVYSPTELKNPYSALTGATPVLRSSEHYFFRLSDPRCLDFLQRKWTTRHRPPAARGAEQDQGMVRREGATRDRRRRPRRLGHQPRRALLRHRDPRRAGQVLLRLARRADRLPRLAEELLRLGKAAADGLRQTSTSSSPTRTSAGALHRQGHHYFHTLFWPAMLHFSGRKTPDRDLRARLHHAAAARR